MNDTPLTYVSIAEIEAKRIAVLDGAVRLRRAWVDEFGAHLDGARLERENAAWDAYLAYLQEYGLEPHHVWDHEKVMGR